MADGAEGGDGGLPNEGVGVGRRRRGEALDDPEGRRLPVAPFAERPRRRLGHERVGVVEEGEEIDVGMGARLGRGAPANVRGGVGEGGRELVVGEAMQPGQGAEGGRPHRRGRVMEERPGGVGVIGVAGDGRATPALVRLRIGVHDADIVVARGKSSPAGMPHWSRMSDTQRVLLAVLTAFLLVSGLAVVVAERNQEPASAETPLLQAAPTTTTIPPTTVPPPPETTVAPPPPEVTKPAPLAGGAVVPPKNSYAPEPIQEIGIIEIPKIGLRHKVMHGITLRNIDRGPSHWPGTPLPGEQGNVVFMGHRTTHSRPFFRINELVPGDEIRFEVAGVKSTYLVTGHEIVTPDRLDIVKPTVDPIVTIFACHPPGSARQRYVVRGSLVVPPAVEESPAPAPAPAGEAAPPSEAPQS